MRIATRMIGGAGLVIGLAWMTTGAFGGRFGGGGARGGGGFGGGVPMSRPPAMAPAARPAPSFQGGAVQRGAVNGPYGGIATGARQTGTVTGAGGGTGTAVRQAGTYTGPHGGVAVGGGRAGTFNTAGGATISGGSHTGPHGTQVIAGGKGGTATGPGGNTVSGGKGGAVVIGPNGNVHATGGKGAAVTGAGGNTIAGGSRGAVTVGPGGAIAGGSHGAVAVGPNGAVAGGSRGVVAGGPSGTWAAGTRYRAATDLNGQGYYVRSGFRAYNAFNPGWYARYPRAWVAAGWVAGSAWTAATWGLCAGTVGYAEAATPYTYDYGDNITYQDGTVYYGDQPHGTEAQYADEATQIADAGQQAQPAANDTWQSLGVFAMVKGDETTSNDIFQFALNKDGVLRGNYYNAVTDAATPVNGALDKKSQRVAWTIGDQKDTVYEAGLFNLTKDQTTMLVHYGKDRTEQYSLVRIEQPAQDSAGPPK